MEKLLTGVSAFVLLFLAGMFVTILHELGHAIPVLLSGRKGVIFLGSYGDTGRSVALRSRWLVVWIRRNPLRWSGGMFVPSGSSSITIDALSIIAGPVLPLLVVGAMYYLTQTGAIHWRMDYFLIMAGLIASIGMVGSLVPSSRPITVHGGGVTYNDGYLLLTLYRYHRHWSEIAAAAREYNDGRYDDAADRYLHLIRCGITDSQTYRVAIASLVAADDPENASLLNEEFAEIHEFDSDDFVRSAEIQARLENYEAGLRDYENALELDPSNATVFNNRGYTFNLMERYEEAVADFDRAIELEPAQAYAYNNRGLALIRLGREAEGLADIDRSMELDADNAYAHRNLGIYHYERGEIHRALECFERASALDPRTHLVESYRQQAAQALANTSGE